MLYSRNNLTLLYLFEFEQNVRNLAWLGIQNIQPGDKTKGDFSLFHFKLISMKKIVKQVAGIDVAQKELVVCLGRMYDDWTPELHASKTFLNTAKGIASFVEWAEKLTDASMPIRFVMEAT